MPGEGKPLPDPLQPQALPLRLTGSTQPEVARAVAAARDEERARLGRDLHDGPSQVVGAARMALSRLAERFPDVPLDPVIETLRLAFEDLRRVARALRPAALEGRTLVQALAGLAADLERTGATKAAFEAPGPERPLAPEVETELYRLAAEACANIARHARAKSARIRLDRTHAARTTLVIEDDGAGLDTRLLDPRDAASGSQRGGGLTSMAERACAMGARLTIDAGPGRGTRIEVTLDAALDAAQDGTRRGDASRQPSERPTK